MASTDRDALVALYNATDGANWKESTNWNKGADLSLWHGIKVNDQGRVVELRLPENNLRGPIPPELGALRELKTLELNNNQLTGSIPKELGALTELKTLWLYHNQLTGAIPKEFGALSKLDTLWLHHNKLTGPIPPELGDLGTLRGLDLSFNKLSGTIPRELGKLTALIWLFLNCNGLTGTIPPELGNLAALTHLRLGGNELSGEIPASLGQLGNLHELYLLSNKLSGHIPPELGNLAALAVLDLQGNKLSGPIPEALGALSKLEGLDLSYNQLTGPVPEALGDLSVLKDLQLQKNKLTGSIPWNMANMKKLTKIAVGGNSALTLPRGAQYRKNENEFYKWMHRDDLVGDLASVPAYRTHCQGSWRAFPQKNPQGVLLEAPVSAGTCDCLEFGDYADVLVERMTDPAAWPVGVGVYAQWGAGKSSLLQLILRELKAKSTASPEGWFTRWLWMTTGGSVVYALWAGLTSAVSCRCCRSPAHDDELNNVEKGLGPTSADMPARVTSVVASFDAWLFADSKVLWAVLISEIFKQVEEHDCFGKGAVRATRVRHAVTSSTCTDWCLVIFTAVVVAGVGAAAGLAGEHIANMQEQLEQVAAAAALAAVPISLLLWICKILPVVFKGQGELILRQAQSMGESVGTAHLGFMADVQDELQVLLGMLERKSTKEHRYMLVVSIDNLDRCPHRQIVKVLEAVHLLLEKDKVNAAVILAMDPRVIIAAIEEDMGEGMRREVSGAEYLDKIIHWPFCIPSGTETERLSLLHSWLPSQDSESPPDTLGTDDVDPDQPREERPSQGDNDANPNREPIETEEVQNRLCRPVEPRNATPPVGGHTEPLDSEDSSGAVSDGNDTESEEKETDAGTSTRVGTPGSSVGGDRAPFATGGEAAPPLQRRTSNYAVHTKEEVEEHEKEIKISSGAVSDGNDTESEEKETDAGTSTGVGTPGSSVGGDRAPFAAGGEAAPPLQRQTSNYAMHTKEEVEELEKMIKAIVTTPRKAKRIYNIYSIQRALARKRASKDNAYDFSRNSARKLLRWTILSEFWPFHTACLVAVVKNTKDTGTLSHLYETKGAEFLSDMLNGKRSSNADPDSMTDSNNPFRAEARRLMGFEEADEDFVRVLSFTPDLLVQDFDEGKLGLLRLSFNLNPAMVARVVAWKRSNW